jgi:S-adenosylmethionine decarboxylase
MQQMRMLTIAAWRELARLGRAKVKAMQGLHLTADLYNCRCEPAYLLDADALGQWCSAAVARAGLQAVNQLFHTFPPTTHGPGGITATVLLAESHLCIHTWPEQRAVTLDVYVCNFGGNHSAKARALMRSLIEHFAPEWTEQRSLDRGESA